MKPVLLIVIDALSSRVVRPALMENRLPNLRRLRDAATYRGESIAVFPSITPAATSSLITGCYPKDHGISGAYWYVAAEKKVVYFGYDVWAVLRQGIDTYMNDFLLRLNEEHLKADTLFETVEKAGLSAANLNYLVYRGNHQHKLEMPDPLGGVRDAIADFLTDGAEEAKVPGPQFLYFGDIIRTRLENGEVLSAPGGPFNRFGIQDETTAELLRQMIDKDMLHDFTVAYFPDNDFQSHQDGPEAAVEKLKDTDDELGRVYSHFGGLEQMLAEICVVLTGDHSQSNVVDQSRNPGIRLDELLDTFSVADAGTPMDEEDDLVICPNLRSAQIYFHTPTPNRVQRVIQRLLGDERIDQMLWTGEILAEEEPGFHIATRDRGRLHFWHGDGGPQSAHDNYGNMWSWDGDLRAVDGHVDDDEGIVTFGEYPNAFERIAGVLGLDLAGHLWATSQPGYEFSLETTKIHEGGGSHGSLHLLDSISPLWVAGAPDGIDLPDRARAVDIATICKSVLGIV